MKCQLNALEILAKDHMKITGKLYMGGRNIKEFFFFLKKEPLFILLWRIF